MKENEKTTPPFLGEPETQEWSPPAPPWDPEPDPLSLENEEQAEADLSEELPGVPLEGAEDQEAVAFPVPESTIPVNIEAEEAIGEGILRPEAPLPGSGRPVTEEFSEFTEEDNGISVNGFFFFMIKAPTGITLNGVHFPAGAYWFNQETYDGIESIDAPFQE